MAHDHEWPKESTEHVWGPWMQKDRKKKWRGCVHPQCPATEEMEVKV